MDADKSTIHNGSEGFPTVVPKRPSFSQAAPLPQLTPEYMNAMYPSYLDLVQVQVFFRHGERTPVHSSFTRPSQWAFCERANYLHSEFMKAIGKFMPRREASLPEPDPRRMAEGHDDSRYTEKTATLKSGVEYEPAAWSVRLVDDRSTEGLDGNQAGDRPAHAAREKWTPAMCEEGQLTDIGLDSLHRTGSHLRALYIDGLGFLPKVPGNTRDYMYIRSTDYSRVLQSTHALLVGLYPGYPESAWTGRWTLFNKAFLDLFPIHTRLHKFETMHGNFGCYNFIKYFFDTSASVARELKWIDDVYQQTVALDSIGEKARDIIAQPAFGSNFHPVYDELVAMKGHGMDLPADVSLDHVNRLGEVAHYQWTHMLYKTVAQRHGFGRLVDGAVQMMVQATQEQRASSGWFARLFGGAPAESRAAPVGPQRTGDMLLGGGENGLREEPVDEVPRVPKIALYGGHDITISPLSIVLGNMSEEWIPFASMLTLELFRDNSKAHNKGLAKCLEKPVSVPKNVNTDGYFVRAKLNDKVLVMPTCEAAGKHHPEMGSSVCTLAAFFEHIAPVIATEQQYTDECGVMPKKMAQS